MKACIVIPTIRKHSIMEFLSEWENEFSAHHVVVVEDNPSKTFDLPSWVGHYAWNHIEETLGEFSWIIPRRSGAIRNFAMLLAARQHPDMIVMLDDDCLPTDQRGDFLARHWSALESPGTFYPIFDTMQTSGTGVLARGFPKQVRKIRTVVNHGLWNNVPDLDGETQLQHPGIRTNFPRHSIHVPRGTLFPFSAMNVAFRPEALPALYQMPMGQGQPFERFDDIWCGWIMKRALDAMGLSVRCGSPFIRHARASDAKRNAEIEVPGIMENETVFPMIQNMSVPSSSLDACLAHIHHELARLGSYWESVENATSIWRRLCAEAAA